MRFSEGLKIANYRVFSRQIGLLFAKTDFCVEETAYFRAFVRCLPNSFPRDFFSFPWNFENVRQNRENIRQNLRKVGENQEKVGEYRGEFQKSPKKEWDKREKQQKFFSRMSQNLDKNGLPF